MKRLKIFLTTEIMVFLIFCLFLLSLRFYPMIFQQKVSVFGDNYSLMVPGKIFLADWLKKGILPLWNPQIFSGLPLINDINQSVLYFTTGLFVLFKPAVALNLSVIVHVLLTMWGAYLLVKFWLKDKKLALLAAALWGLSTQISGSINNLSTIQSVTWFPWLAYWGLKLHQHKKYVLVYALFVLIHFLAGYPQHVIYAIAFSVLLSAFWHWRKLSFKQWFYPWLWTAIFSVLLSAIVWLPFVEMLLDSTRTQQSLEQAQIGSLKPGMLMKMFLPYFFDKQSIGIKWGPSWSGQPNVLFYFTNFGVLGLLLVMFNKKLRNKEDWLFLIFTVATIIFSLGSYLPGFEVIQKIIPLFKVGRYPSMVLLLTNLALVIWVCSMLKRLKIKKNLFKLVLWLGILACVLSLVLYFVVSANFADFWLGLDQLVKHKLSTSVFHTLERDHLIFNMVGLNLITASVFFVAAWLAFYYQRKMLLVLILSLDLLVHTQGMFFFAPSQIYDYEQMNLFKTQLQDNQHRSLTRDSNQPYTDYGTYWEAMVVRRPFSDSFIDQQELTSFQNLRHLRDAYTPNWNIVVQLPMVHGYTTLLPKDYAAIWAKTDEARINFIDYVEPSNPQLKNWAVKYYLVDRLFAVKEETNFKVLAQDGSLTLYELPNVLSRFRYANNQPVELIDFVENPNQLSFKFNNENNQQSLIIADRYDRNWQAWINGQPVILQNYQGMRQLEIKPGENKLVLKFVPKFFYLGAVISAGGFVFAWWWFKKLSSFFSNQ